MLAHEGTMGYGAWTPTHRDAAKEHRMSKNLVANRSSVVHAPSPIQEMEPLCSAGRKRDTRTFYRPTNAPVTCKNCGPDERHTTKVREWEGQERF